MREKRSSARRGLFCVRLPAFQTGFQTAVLGIALADLFADGDWPPLNKARRLRCWCKRLAAVACNEGWLKSREEDFSWLIFQINATFHSSAEDAQRAIGLEQIADEVLISNCQLRSSPP